MRELSVRIYYEFYSLLEGKRLLRDSAVLLDLYRLTSHTALWLQREDWLRNRECVALCALPPQKIYRVFKFTHDKAL